MIDNINEIYLDKIASVTIPIFYIEAGVNKNLDTNALKLLNIVFAHLSSERHSREMCLTKKSVIYFFDIKSESVSLTLQRAKTSLLEYAYTEDFTAWKFIFENIEVENGSIAFTLAEEFYTKYLQGIVNSARKVITNLDELLRLCGYEQRLYLMCRPYANGESGKRFKDNDFEKMKMQLGIADMRSLTSASKYKSNIIEKSCVNISANTRIIVLPSLSSTYDRYGKQNKVGKAEFVVIKRDEKHIADSCDGMLVSDLISEIEKNGFKNYLWDFSFDTSKLETDEWKMI